MCCRWGEALLIEYAMMESMLLAGALLTAIGSDIDVSVFVLPSVLAVATG